MSDRWTSATWGEVAGLEYGKALHGYQEEAAGKVRVYGTNGPIGWTAEAMGKGPTVVVGRKGAHRGVHYAPRPFWVIDTAYWLKPLQPMNLRWAYYQLLTHDIDSRDSGSAIPSLSRQDFYTFPVELPPLPEQDAIVEALGALDDKIDANRRLAATARTLAISLVVGAQEATSVGELASVGRRQLRVADFNGKQVEYYSLPAFDNGAVSERCAGDVIRSSKFFLDRPSVLLGKLNPHIPRVWHAVPANDDATPLASTEFVVLQPTSSLTSEELWAACSVPAFMAAVQEQVTGTTGSHQRVSPDDVLASAVPDPRSLGHDLRSAITPLVDRADAALAESERLAALRDALLPPLMDGRLRVRDLAA